MSDCNCGHPFCSDCDPTVGKTWCYSCGKYVRQYKDGIDLASLCEHGLASAKEAATRRLEAAQAEARRLGLASRAKYSGSKPGE